MPFPPIRIAACGALTALGDETATHAALLSGRSALIARPVHGSAGGDLVPLALLPGRPYDETLPPGWLPFLRDLADRIPPPQISGLRPQVSGLTPHPSERWGEPGRPVFVTGSNFGVSHLHAYRANGGDARHLDYGTPAECVAQVAAALGWGPDVTILSHACVSSHLGLLQASRVLAAGLAEEALVFSFDFISAFVAGGFHALKILNADFPAPYQDRPVGSIALGDGAAFAVLTRDRGDFAISGQTLHNEMHHFTANRADGAGFEACLAPLPAAVAGRRVWLKGHGTGTLETGRLEATALAKHFPGAPLVSWKGALGHTLGSCGLVELALAVASLRAGRAPGTIGANAPGFTPEVAFTPFDLAGYDGVVCTSNAFGGAHAAFLLHHA
jgi:hypothetical protein